jgi:hypothetical protein
MATGENAGTWGQITNTNLYLLQQAIGGYEAISIAGGAQTTALTMSNGAISNARNAVIKLTGTITGNQIVTIPTAIEKTYIVANDTTGAFTVEFKQAGGTGVTFAAADKSTKILFADGTNIVETGNTTPIITQINDTNVNEQIKFTTTASAVNEFTITNAATANAPEISATGSDTNIDLKITPKGSGKINLDGIKFPNADGSSGQFLRTDGSGSLSFADSGLAWQSVVTTSTVTVVAGRAYFINTTSAACTVTLPSGTPTAGAQVQLVDYAGTFDTNACVINPNGNKIEGGTGNLQLSGEREGVILTYIDATQGWLATSGINEGTDALQAPPYSIDFLVIAGGGAGARPTHSGGFASGGGGGAGGFRTSTQTVNAGTVITVTVGDGATADPAGSPGSPAIVAGSGTASSISGSGLTTISSAGGGGGAGGGLAGANGGSGGGAGNSGAGTPSGGSGNTPNTSPSQGNNGGAVTANAPNFGSGGGGGASAVGVNSTGTTGGNGGAGTASSITGSSVTRAGGGGGGTHEGGTAGTGGAGNTAPGGNAGAGGGTNNGVAGTVNTGSGGGGATTTNAGGAGSVGGNGGKGVVILSMPDANYTGTTTGSPTVATGVSGKTVLTFNGTGSYTA